MAKLTLISGMRTYVSRGLTYVGGVQYESDKLGETAEDQIDGVHVFEIVGETSDAVQVIAPAPKGGDKKPNKTITVGKGKTASVDASGDMDTGAAAIAAEQAAAEAEAAAAAAATGGEGANGDDQPSVTI